MSHMQMSVRGALRNSVVIAKGQPCVSLQYLVDLPIVHVERMRALDEAGLVREIGGGDDVR